MDPHRPAAIRANCSLNPSSDRRLVLEFDFELARVASRRELACEAERRFESCRAYDVSEIQLHSNVVVIRTADRGWVIPRQSFTGLHWTTDQPKRPVDVDP